LEGDSIGKIAELDSARQELFHVLWIEQIEKDRVVFSE
jgi:hypothetical protein